VRKLSKKCSKELYCQFLIAAQGNFAATNLSSHLQGTAHDAITRFLSRTKLTPKILWEYAQPFVDLHQGYLVVDDTVLDHFYGEKISLARWQYSGTHHRVVRGIGLTTLLWAGTAGEHIPADFRIYAPEADGATKNQHTREMLRQASDRGFQPKMVVLDSWYSAVDTLHLIGDLGWKFVSGLKGNRVVFTKKENGRMKRWAIEDLEIPSEGRIVHLKDFGPVRVFLLVAPDGKGDYYATNNLDLTLVDIREAAARRWKIEEFHRGLKQTTGVEMCQARTARSQRTHIFCSILSFLALEKKRLEEGTTWYESKRRIIADSLFFYLRQPLIKLPVPAG